MVEPIADVAVHRSRPPVTGQTIYDFREPIQDWAESRLNGAVWTPGSAVLDAGCGTGVYVEATRRFIGATGYVVGLDIGYERVSVTPSDAPIVGDAQSLPFVDHSFDVVLAMHMLYHVPDIGRAVKEFRRVLRPDGSLIASTNSAMDEPELIDLFLECGGADPDAFGDWRFCSENAEDLLAVAFGAVETHVEESILVVPDQQPVVRSMNSMRYLLEGRLRGDTDWVTFLDRVEASVARKIAESGTFNVTCRTSVYVCR